MHDLPPKPEVHMVSEVSQTNPLLKIGGAPHFDQITPEHVVPAVNTALDDAEAKLSQLEHIENPTWETLMQPLEELEQTLHQVIGPVVHLSMVKNSDDLRLAWETVQPRVINFDLKLKQNENLAREMKKLNDSGRSFSTAQKRILSKKLLDAKLAGLELQGDERDQFNAMQVELAQIQNEFRNNLLDATKAYSLIIKDKEQLKGLPQSYLELASETYDGDSTPENGPWKLSLEPTIFQGAMKYIESPTVRETLYRAFITRASSSPFDNSVLIPRILELRQKSARLLGYPHFAEMSIETKMAPSVEKVDELLESLRLASWEKGKKELDAITAYAASKGYPTPLKHWDTAFWSERLREEKFQFTEEELRPYFQLPRVLDGLFSLTQKLFGVTVKSADHAVPVWNSDVRYFTIHDEKGEQIASFYLDPYSRPENKRGGAWMEDCLTRCYFRGHLQLPIVYLACNMPPPTGNNPSLLTFREVETIFHEFGHGLQHMLTTIDYASVSGTNGIEWDAVEIASQFMENWCRHKETLRGMTSHIKTGEPLPDSLYEKIVKAHTYMTATAMLRQLQFGMVDMELHHTYDPKGKLTPFDIMKKISTKTSHLPYFDHERFLCSFSHIFVGEGYSAGYYSYKWSEVLASDAFSAFEEVDLNNPEEVARVGKHYRDTILAEGGGRDPMEVFISFRGREPDIEPLLRHTGLKED